MIVKRLPVGPLETNCWIVSDENGGPSVVIDPGEDLERIVAALDGAVVAAIILTHGHFDHLGAAGGLIAVTHAPLLVHADDASRLSSPGAEGTGGAVFGFSHVAPEPDRVLVDGDEVTAGALVLRVLHTPGHTPGGISLFVEDAAGAVPHLFAGDTVFAGSVGRTDFPGGDARTLSRSIAEKIAPLPPETIVHPGHGPDTTIGREARINPFWPRA